MNPYNMLKPLVAALLLPWLISGCEKKPAPQTTPVAPTVEQKVAASQPAIPPPPADAASASLPTGRITRLNRQYTMETVDEVPDNFRLSIGKSYPIVMLYRSADSGWIITAGNVQPEEAKGLMYLQTIHTIRKEGDAAFYLLQMHSGGNAGYSQHVLIDVQKQLLSTLPLVSENPKVRMDEASQLFVSGVIGFDKLLDPITVRLQYVIRGKEPPFSGNWVDVTIDPKYRKLIGVHPWAYFSDKQLRQPLLRLAGPDGFVKIREHTGVAPPSRVVNGHLLVLEGCKPHACGGEDALTLIDMRTGKLFAMVTMTADQTNQTDVMTFGTVDSKEETYIGGFAYSVYQTEIDKFLARVNKKAQIQPNGTVTVR